MKGRLCARRELLIGVAVSFSVLSVVSAAQDIRAQEVAALIDIKSQWTSPRPDFLDTWDEYATDASSFSHVTTDDNKSVSRLELPSQQMSGTLSPSISNLTNLQYLSLQGNNLSGAIPAEIGTLAFLGTLALSNNSFTGSIPASLGSLKSVEQIMLAFNHLSGRIPDSLAGLKGLSNLDLSYDNLSGVLPKFSASTKVNVQGNLFLCRLPGMPSCGAATDFSPAGQTNSSDTVPDGRHGYNKGALVCGLSVGVSLLIASVSCGIGWWRRHPAKQAFFDVHEHERDKMALGQLKKFSFRELQVATNYFDTGNILGRGGFGNVYKGRLPDGTLVAVKRLREEGIPGGEIQFQMEVEMISLAVHRNLLRLLGFCMTHTERLLVYPYMPNGSVASRLRVRSLLDKTWKVSGASLYDSVFQRPALDWSTRRRIALGAARGLLYLHEHCDPKIIHRDVKAANVLLDQDFEAVVGDFGLARLLDHTDSHVTTAVRGTVGHIAPEYLSTGQSSEKTDVFSFGILLLELITGHRAFDFGRISSQQDVILLDWVKKLQQEKRLNLLVDADLKQKYDTVELDELVQVALLCTQVAPTDRPKMAEVVRMLEGDRLAECWQTYCRAESQRTRHAQLIPRKYYELVPESAYDIEAVELSGPR